VFFGKQRCLAQVIVLIEENQVIIKTLTRNFIVLNYSTNPIERPHIFSAIFIRFGHLSLVMVKNVNHPTSVFYQLSFQGSFLK